MFTVGDVVVLTHDFKDLKAGAVGTVVDIIHGPGFSMASRPDLSRPVEGCYEVEFKSPIDARIILGCHTVRDSDVAKK